VAANHGRVVKGLGDGVMATFAGAADAVAAAVAIQQGIDRLNRSGRAPVPLAVRVGLSAGDVSVEDDDVHGTPVIEASRLCATAVGAEILASDVVRWLGGAQGAPVLAPVGSLELKGLATPVPTVRVEWEPAPASAIPMPALLTDIGRIFVGRDAELERLGQLRKEAAAGERRVALVAGEPGVGKTRLAAELAIRVQREGAVVLAGRCDEDLGVPYQPFVEALRHFVDHTPPGELEERLGRYGGELTRLVPELTEGLADLPEPLRSDPETERYRMFDAVAAWLTAAAAEDPVVLVLDDLQWAAKPTLLLLRHIVRTSDVKRLFILGTYRDTELTHDHPLVELLADLRRDGTIERVALMGLDDAGVAALVEKAAGQVLDEDGIALASAIYRETEGNPFFVREVLRHLAETGALQQHEGRWAARLPIEELGIPEGVREVVGRRLARLADGTQPALRLAAVVGVEFDLAVLRAAGALDEDPLISALDEAMAARVISETGVAGRYRFAHALVRDTLYRDLSDPRRIALHRRVAEAIERVHAARLDDHLPALAHHWAQASPHVADSGKAVEYATRAGERALAQLAHDEAVGYYRQALDLLTTADPSEQSRRLELLISLGEAQRRAGDPEHRRTLLDAAALAARMGDADALARAALANNRGIHSSSRGVDGERLAVLEQALAALPEADSIVRARLLAILASELCVSSEHDRRYRVADDALAMARRIGDPSTLGRVLVGRLPGLVWDADRAREMAEFTALAGRMGDPALVFWAKAMGGVSSLTLGDIRAFSLDIDEAVRLADEFEQPIMRWVASAIQSTARRLSGKLDEAERVGRHAMEVGEAAGLPDARHLYENSSLFWIRYDQGRLSALVETCERHASGTAHHSQGLGNLGLVYAELGRLADARAVLDRLAADDFAVINGGMSRIIELTVATEICAAVADRPRAEALHGLLAPHRGLIAHRLSASTGPIDHHLGLLETTLGRFDAADSSFASAAAFSERSGVSVWDARTRLDWARMLLARQDQFGLDRGRELLGQALGTARELGLAKVERDTVALLQECD